MKLQWSAVKTSDTLLGYNLYRRKANESYNTAPITDFPIEMNEYTDATTTKDQNYYYKVKAIYKNQVESQSSSEVFVTPKNKQIILQVDNPFMTVNGERKEVDIGNGTKPIIVNGRTLLPIRSLIEELAGDITWSGEERKVTLQLNDSKIELWIDKKLAIVNGNEEELDVPPTIINGRTMIPLRFVIENLVLVLDWDGETKTITIIYNTSDLQKEESSKWYDSAYTQPLSEQFGKYMDSGFGYSMNYPLIWGKPQVTATEKYHFETITTFYKSANMQIITYADIISAHETYYTFAFNKGYIHAGVVWEENMHNDNTVYYISSESNDISKEIILIFKYDQVLVIENTLNSESLSESDRDAYNLLNKIFETLEVDQAVG